MSNTNDGGPAFPVPEVVMEGREGATAYAVSEQGMTLRDYFAAKAMQGWMASYGETTVHPADRNHPNAAKRNDMLAAIASDAYAIADAMLAARRA